LAADEAEKKIQSLLDGSKKIEQLKGLGKAGDI
jgi:hypothetical protein